jgi:hypothetical protein
LPDVAWLAAARRQFQNVTGYPSNCGPRAADGSLRTLPVGDRKLHCPTVLATVGPVPRRTEGESIVFGAGAHHHLNPLVRIALPYLGRRWRDRLQLAL